MIRRAAQRALADLPGGQRHHLREMARKLADTITAERWSVALTAAGLTAGALIGSYPAEQRQAFNALSTSVKSRCQSKRKAKR